ncbi:MAG: VWA domain-containing protein [Pseudomonadota bacterium]
MHSVRPVSPAKLSHLSLTACSLALASVLLACTQDPATRTAAPDVATLEAEPVADERVVELSTLTTVAPQRVSESAAVQHKAAVAYVQSAEDSLYPLPHPTAAPGDTYHGVDANPIMRTADQPVSTFGLDVDTGSYAIVRRHITHGQLPPTDAVRTEELINYFDYAATDTTFGEHPFSLSTELAVAPWHKERYLLRVAVDAASTPRAELPPANLVFLIDVSGSMHDPDKLPLLQSAMRLLTRQLDGDDRVSIVTYAGQSAVVLEPTDGDETATINAAIAKLGAGGSTHGAAGLRDAYRLAEQAFIDGGINRVMLATDGDFNVGETNHDALVRLIERKRKSGVALSTLGFGQGNYNDHLMEQLADHGNGNYAYIDSLREARKVLDQELGATLHTVAHDAKIQVEFNPATVAEYRLIGYENRALREQDFDNDRIDAGDIGAGHSVTALYELALVGSDGTQLPERRFTESQRTHDADTRAIAEVRLRYKASLDTPSTRIDRLLSLDDTVERGSDSLRFSASVAAWGQWLREDSTGEAFGPLAIRALAETAIGADTAGHRREFLELVDLSGALREQS